VLVRHLLLAAYEGQPEASVKLPRTVLGRQREELVALEILVEWGLKRHSGLSYLQQSRILLVLSDVNWRYVGIPEGRGFSPAGSAPHPADGKHCFHGHPLPKRGRGL